MNTPSPAALRAATAWFRQPLDIRLHQDVITELAALIDREFQSAPITEAQVTAYLREKCAELQRKAGGRYASLEVDCRLMTDGTRFWDWIAYVEGGKGSYSKTADEAIAAALKTIAPDEKAAKLRAEIAERQTELAKLEAGK
jgi:hypothetical protein